MTNGYHSTKTLQRKESAGEALERSWGGRNQMQAHLACSNTQ